MQRPRRHLLRLAMLAAALGGGASLAGCTGQVISNDFPDDMDGDGYAAPDDCDDDNEDVNPEAPERCDDGIDNDCNGQNDHDDPVCTEDADGDGYAIAKDCDDGDAAVHPDAGEACDDGIDNNCDGLLDWDDADACLILNG